MPAHIRVTASALRQIEAQPRELRDSLAMLHWGTASGYHVLIEHGPTGPTASLCLPLCLVDPAAAQVMMRTGTLRPSGDGLFQGVSTRLDSARPAALDMDGQNGGAA